MSLPKISSSTNAASCLVGLALIIGVYLAVFRKTSLSAAGLKADPRTLHFGTVWATSSFSWHLRLTNPGGNAIKILGVKTDCGCTSSKSEELTILSNETKDIELQIDLSKVHGETAFAPANFRTIVMLLCKSDNTWTETLDITGSVRRSMESPSSIVDLGEWTEGNRPDSKCLQIRCSEEVDRLVVKRRSELLDVVVDSLGDHRFNLICEPGEACADEGIHRGTFVVAALSPTGAELGSQEVVVSGTALPAIYTLPSSIRLGAVEVGSRQNRQVKVASRHGEQLKIVAIRASGSPVVAELAAVGIVNGNSFMYGGYHGIARC